MTIFCIANTKGGVGKSTTTVQVSTGFALAGQDPWVVDGDKKQTSALLALSMRSAAGLPGIPAVELSDGATLRAQVRLQAPKYRHTIIDVGARDSGALRAALSVADVLIVPFAPRSFDLWAYENMVELVKEAQELRDVQVVPFLNMADPPGQGSDNEATIAAIEGYGFKVAGVRLGNRKAIERASASGRNVSEYKPVDGKAREEVDALVQLLLQNYGNITA
ncbi:AAA family ATPase [Massilia dura]|uniref:AAA family ATPase n=1 Tax=Pseudoduganella dura TaxID=321982 RepID=A0A6I3XBM9_9BURK|nr:AAA family ATPase [Pseudoduganella dura]MUI10881.1 AAA family ATPase [Pseudoduganella dura]GGY12737.1 partition protein [Pseudoduganella dura]